MCPPDTGVSWAPGCGGLGVGAGCASPGRQVCGETPAGTAVLWGARSPRWQWDLRVATMQMSRVLWHPQVWELPGFHHPWAADALQPCGVSPLVSWCSCVTRSTYPCPAASASPVVFNLWGLLLRHFCSSQNPWVQALGHPKLAATPGPHAFATSLNPRDLPSLGFAASLGPCARAHLTCSSPILRHPHRACSTPSLQHPRSW